MARCLQGFLEGGSRKLGFHHDPHNVLRSDLALSCSPSQTQTATMLEGQDKLSRSEIPGQAVQRYKVLRPLGQALAAARGSQALSV
eukprot:5635377-Amphidinium_carterae.1